MGGSAGTVPLTRPKGLDWPEGSGRCAAVYQRCFPLPHRSRHTEPCSVVNAGAVVGSWWQALAGDADKQMDRHEQPDRSW